MSNYDKTAKDKNDFQSGDKVLIREKNIWVPRVIVSKDVYPRSYWVEGENGVLRRTSKHLKLSGDMDINEFMMDNDDLIIVINAKKS